MTTYRCLVCGTSARRLPDREADLLTSSWLSACGLCAARQLAETVEGILHDIRDMSRDADDYADAGLLPDELEAQINALADVAKSLTTDDEPTEPILTARSAS